MTEGRRIRLHSSSVESRVDQLCDQWEQALQRGYVPQANEYLKQVAAVEREQLLRELVLVHLDYVASPQRPELIENYLQRLPEFADLLLRLWAQSAPSSRAGEDASVEHAIYCTNCGTKHAIVDRRPAKTISATGEDFHSTCGDERSRQFGHYRLLEHLGSGGFGTVYRAYDDVLQRIVAVKVPRTQETEGSEQDRLLREARAAGRLEHPGIVKVLEVGRHHGTPFLVAEYVNGRPLSERLRHKMLPKEEAVLLIAQVAEALDHAHIRQVIHRDLKPSNILIDAQGKPRISDFGLAKQDTGAITVTIDGKLLGTPAYMSPEQADGGAHHVDRRSDIYSLGVILFEVLTGELPFRGSPRGIIQQMLTQDAVAPSTLCSTIDRDLDTVCLKCLERAPGLRYQTAASLAHDLRSWLQGKPVQARPVGRAVKWARWAKRRPMVSGLSATIMLLVIGAATALTWQWHQMQKVNRQLVWRNVESLQVATPDTIDTIMASIEPYRSQLQPRIRRELARSDLSARERIRLSLLADSLSSEQISLLENQVLVSQPAELLLIRHGLAHSGARSRRWLVEIMQDAERWPRERLRAACVWVGLRSDEQDSPALMDEVTDLLLSVDLLELEDWLPLMAPCEVQLAPRLRKKFTDSNDAQVRVKTAWALGYIANEDVAALSELLLRADRRQFPVLLTLARKALAEGGIDSATLLAELRRPQSNRARLANQSLALGALASLHEVVALLQWSGDRTLRTEIIDRLPGIVTLHKLLSALNSTDNTAVQQALLICIGQLRREQVSPTKWQSVTDTVRRQYLYHPDGAIRSTAEWILRRFDQKISKTTTRPLAGRDWYIAPTGHTMMRISSTNEQRDGRSGIPDVPTGGVFFLASREVTVSQYRKFRPDYRPPKAVRSHDTMPALGIKLADAAAYCNWLSKQDDICASQWCYPADGSGPGGQAADPSPGALTGYRLPTPEQWTYACKAGSGATYSFGDDPRYLTDHAWFIENARTQFQPCGQLQPNAFGLFDMLGNAHELCSTATRELETGKVHVTVHYCGGSVRSSAPAVAANRRVPSLREIGLSTGGFRVARIVSKADLVTESNQKE